MNMEDLLGRLFELVTAQVRLPAEYAWAPLGAAFALVVGGLLFLIRGAKWAPGFTAVAFLGLGGVGGYYLTPLIGTPLAVTVALTAVVSALIGIGFFRFWQAAALAGCLMCAGFGVYFARVLTPEVNAWLEPEPADVVAIQLPDAGTVVGEARDTALTKVSSLWSHLSATVPNFQLSFWSVICSTGLAGLIFGLLLPRASRALWATSIGTVLLGVGSVFVLKQYSPDSLTWLKSNTTWAWGVVGVIWLTGFLYNFTSVRRRKAPTDASADAVPAAKTATT